MNKKERLLKILNGEKADRPAVICPGGMMNPCVTELIEKHGIDFAKANSEAEEMAKLSKLVVEENLFENYAVPFCMSVESEMLGAKCVYGTNEEEAHIVEYAMDKIDIDKLKSVKVKFDREEALLGAIKLLKNDEIPVIGNITGPFSVATSVVDAKEVYVGLKKNKEAFEAFMDYISDMIADLAIKEVDAGADLIAIADPSGTAEILGPKYFEEYLIHYVNYIIDKIKAHKDVPIIIHICGDMKSVIDIVEKIHADAYSFDAIVNLKNAKKHIHKPVMGNVSTYLIENQRPEQISKVAKNRVKDGVDIIAPACGLGMGSPLDNVKAILKGVEDA